MLEDVGLSEPMPGTKRTNGSGDIDAAIGYQGGQIVKRWSAVINHSRASGKPPQTAEFDGYDGLKNYLESGSEVVTIAIYRNVACLRTCSESAADIAPPD